MCPIGANNGSTFVVGALALAISVYALWSQVGFSCSNRLDVKRAIEDEDPVAWIWDIITEAEEEPQEIHPTLQELGHLIETNDRIGLLFQAMFQQDSTTNYSKTGVQEEIQNYQQMLRGLNYIVSRAPPFYSSSQLIGLSITALLRDYTATPSGFAAFLDPEVNEVFRKVLDAWGDFLQSPKSASTLDDPSKGWFSNSGLAALAASGNTNGSTYEFREIFACNSSALYYGFRSCDDFFTRKFREDMRPIAAENDDNIIVSACEAETTQLARDVKAHDTFWMKGTTYSLDQMLGKENAGDCVGGTIYQGLLNAFNYHRWHAPVSGTIVKTYTIQGTYYSTPAAIEDGTGGLVDYPAYNSAMATRSVVLIKSENPAIGLMAFIAVGMVEVSSCEVTVKEGQYVKKGDEIGMFHYGGSTHCLVFQKGVNITGFPETEGNVAVRSQLATVQS